MARIGIYGGSFDPVHYGHLNVAKSAIGRLALDKLIVMPANVSPFKTDRHPELVSAEPLPLPAATSRVYEWAERLEQVRAIFAGIDKCVVDDRELRRGGVSYAIDTVKEIRAEYSAVSSADSLRLYFIIGEDSVEGLPRWKDYETLKTLCEFVSFPRTKESSTEIRGLFAEAGVGLNPDAKTVEVVRAGLVRKNGFCPCRLPKNPEFFCPCDEFKSQMRDPSYHGLCHCRLYLKP